MRATSDMELVCDDRCRWLTAAATGNTETFVSAHKAAHHVGIALDSKGRRPGPAADQADEQQNEETNDQAAAGTDGAMREVMARGQRFVQRGLPVLILGETGTGKERFARALHASGTRAQGPLVALNCASIPETLIESELFGYAKGAFSGALPGGMKGKLVQAHGGTLLLDEIGDMPAGQQARLLRALSEREITPLGASAPVAIDFQLICATHQNLEALVEAGLFRADLYYRIAVGVVRLPALRERSDLRELVERIAQEEAGGPVTITRGAWDSLQACAWPGNVRQLRAALRYACAIARHGRIETDDLPQELMRVRAPLVRSGAAAAPLSGEPPQSHRGAYRERVLNALARTRWNISGAARDLGVCRSTLYRQLKSLGIRHIRDAGMAPFDSEIPHTAGGVRRNQVA